jgi:hypothetical protein
VPHLTGYLQTSQELNHPCIDHIFANYAEICSKAVPTSIGCSDYNIVAISMKLKVPKAGPNIVYKKSYKMYCSDSYVEDVNNICWSVV